MANNPTGSASKIVPEPNLTLLLSLSPPWSCPSHLLPGPLLLPPPWTPCSPPATTVCPTCSQRDPVNPHQVTARKWHHLSQGQGHVLLHHLQGTTDLVPPSLSLPITHSTPGTGGSLRHSQHPHTSEPLQCLFPLPGMLVPTSLHCSSLHFCSKLIPQKGPWSHTL